MDKADSPGAERLSLAKCVSALLMVYYVWNVAYPTAYKHVLDFVDFKLLGTSIAKQLTLEKFQRQLDNWQKSQQ